jgi:hypothetical protein
LVDEALWAAILRKRIFPAYQFDMIAERIGPELVEFIDDGLCGATLVLEVAGRREENANNSSGVRH